MTTNSTTNAASNQQLEPPQVFKVRWCPTCGRDDRVQMFKNAHYSHGEICRGVPIEIEYSRVSAGGVVATQHHHKHCSSWTVTTSGDKKPCDCVCACGHSMYEHIRPGEHYWYEDCAVDGCPCMKFSAPTASPAAPKEEAPTVYKNEEGEDETTCANCGAKIIRSGDHWIHKYGWNKQCISDKIIATPATTPSPDAARHYFCSCGGALTAEEYIEHYFEKRHDHDDAGNQAAAKIADYFNAPPSAIPAIQRIIQRCFAGSKNKLK